MKQIVVDKNEAGQRLDKLLMKYLNKAPKSFIYKMLRKKNITLNGKKADGSEKIQLADEIKLFLSDETIENFSESFKTTLVNTNLDVVYEDKNILIVNKPQGLLSQKAVADDISLVEHVISYLVLNNKISVEELQTFKPGICNRLDRNTSGLVVAGKTLVGLQVMSELFRNRTLDKYYLCIVSGKVTAKKIINGYLIKDESKNQVRIVKNQMDGSDYIQTEYEPIVSNDSFTLLKVKLITGKTHQIRAHLSSISHPIIGDSKYGNRRINDSFNKKYGLNYQLLHSYQIHFPNLEDEFKTVSNQNFTCKLPNLFKKIVDDLFPNGFE